MRPTDACRVASLFARIADTASSTTDSRIGTAARGELRATVRSLSACQDNQFSLDGDRNGLFTGTLLVVWDDGLFKGTYGSFHQQILELMPPNQSPNHLVIGPPTESYDVETPFSI